MRVRTGNSVQPPSRVSAGARRPGDRRSRRLPPDVDRSETASAAGHGLPLRRASLRALSAPSPRRERMRKTCANLRRILCAFQCTVERGRWRAPAGLGACRSCPPAQRAAHHSSRRRGLRRRGHLGTAGRDVPSSGGRRHARHVGFSRGSLRRSALDLPGSRLGHLPSRQADARQDVSLR